MREYKSTHYAILSWIKAVKILIAILRTLQTARSMRQKPKNGLLPKFIYVHFLNPKRLKAQATELLDDIRVGAHDHYFDDMCGRWLTPLHLDVAI
jgi:hypothetical protein